MDTRPDDKLSASFNSIKTFFYFPDASPRIYLFFFAVTVQLTASFISGIGYSTYEGPYWIAGMVIWIFWFIIMFIIAMPQTDNFLERQRAGLKRGAVLIFFTLFAVGILEILLLVFFVPGYVKSRADNDLALSIEQLHHSFQYNDGTALSHQAVENFLDGKNPYAHSNIVAAITEYSGAWDRITPLRTGRFADVFPYPSPEQLKEVWDDALLHPSPPPPEIESRVCYPAGSFLLPAPLIAAGISDIRMVYFIFVIGGMAYVFRQIKGNKRFLFIALLAISLETWNIIAIGETGVLVFPLLLIAWVNIGRNNWLSALFMGLAVASKQVAWFFVPFYLILLWRRSGEWYLAASLGIMVAVFAAFNARFIADDPKLWMDSVASPMIDSMFPLGVGFVSFVGSGLLDIRSAFPFTVMELAVLAGAIIWYWRYSARYPDAGPVLAMLPMFFAWRSLWPYFFYLTIIVYASMLIRESDNEKRKASPAVQPQ